MTFDASLFMGATMTEPNARRPPIPAGTVLLGIMKKPTFRQTKGKDDPEKLYTWLDIPIELDLTSNPAVHQVVGMDKVTLTWSTGVDITPTGFDMSTGKNNGLRQLREALDLNKPGDVFSIPMAEGRPVSAKIKNEPYQEEILDKIASIARPA